MGSENPLDAQVGGSHYKGMTIQPIEFITANCLGFIEGSVIKYVCRHQLKGGVDIDKAIHYLQILRETVLLRKSSNTTPHVAPNPVNTQQTPSKGINNPASQAGPQSIQIPREANRDREAEEEAMKDA